MLSFPLPVRTARAFIVNFPGSNLEFMIMASLFCFVYKYQCAISTHLGALKRNTAAFILLFGISHSRFYGLAAWAIFYVPDLFGICHFLLVLWAYSYLCRFISTIPRVTQIGPSLCFGWFFLVCCFIRFEKCVVISWLSVFCSCYQSGRSGAGLLNYTRYSVCDGVPGSAWLVAPLFPLIFFFPVSVESNHMWYM